MSRGKYLALNAERKEKSNTCLQSWCCGFPSLFVPSFLQMEGRVRLQGLSSQRPSCTCRQDTNRKREHSCSVYTNGGDSLAVRVHYSEVIKVPDFGGQRLSAGRGGGGHSQLPRWRRNLLECCGSCWVQTGASRWRWRACGQSIGSPFACRCHGALPRAGRRLTGDTDRLSA